MNCYSTIFGIALYFIGLTEAKVLICYWGTWANYRFGNGRFTIDNVDPFACTHIVYTFFGVSDTGGLKVLDPYMDLSENWGLGFIDKFNGLKEINPNLRTIAAAGGWNEGSAKFSRLAATQQGRETFAKDAVEFCLKYGFDGFDLDWEYPAQRDGNPDVDKQNHVLLVQELSRRLHEHELLFTAAVAATANSSSQSYDIPAIAKELDYINVMTYDFNGAWDKVTGINAPLNITATESMSDAEKERNVVASIQHWIQQGAPREKLVLGLPLYGRSFTLANPTETGVGAPVIGPGQAGRYTQEAGFIGYNEFCEKQLQQPWTRYWHDDQQVPYAVLGNQWFGYDDIESLSLKAWYARDQDLGGVMVWSIETDDFRNICGDGKNPLLSAIKSIFFNGVSPSPPTPPPPTLPQTTGHPIIGSTTTSGSSTAATTSGPPGQSHDECEVDGITRDPVDCSIFYICNNRIKYTKQCIGGLVYDLVKDMCNWPAEVEC